MSTLIAEYRYTPDARRRIAVLLLINAVLGATLIGLLLMRWGEFSGLILVLGMVLLGIILATGWANLLKLGLRVQIWPDRLVLRSPLLTRAIPWADVTEVRRMSSPTSPERTRWVCTLRMRTRRGVERPYVVFDQQLESAEDALRTIVARTSHARHAI